jgi:hypothetical protein
MRVVVFRFRIVVSWAVVGKNFRVAWLYFFFWLPDCGVFAGMVESGSEHQRLEPLSHDPMA